MKRYFLASTVLAVAGSTAAQTSPQLSAIVKAAHASEGRPKDKFAPASTASSAEGVPFKIQIVPDGDEERPETVRSGWWRYEKGRLLYLLGSKTQIDSQQFKPVETYRFAGRMTPGKAYIASNAFGASARVTVENWSFDGIGIVSQPKGDKFPDGLAPIPISGDYFVYELMADGPTAKALTQKIRLVIEGTLAKAPHVVSITDCDSRRSRPKFDVPFEINRDACWVGANISRIAYVNIATGEVLKEYVSED